MRKKLHSSSGFDEGSFFSRFPIKILLPFLLMIVIFVFSVFMVDLIPRDLFTLLRISVKALFIMTAMCVFSFILFGIKKPLMHKMIVLASAASIFAYLLYKYLR
ncbi:hypothetical protein JW890_08190 [candidate division WOR-3 bacterium]|nr:hypothetical protein [candidate division WOR-3 bacterium]